MSRCSSLDSKKQGRYSGLIAIERRKWQLRSGSTGEKTARKILALELRNSGVSILARQLWRVNYGASIMARQLWRVNYGASIMARQSWRKASRSNGLSINLKMEQDTMRQSTIQDLRITMCYSANKGYNQQFARRKKSLIRRTNQLAQLCQADIALIIRKNNRYYTYRSLVDKDWPPTRAEIVCYWI